MPIATHCCDFVNKHTLRGQYSRAASIPLGGNNGASGPAPEGFRSPTMPAADAMIPAAHSCVTQSCACVPDLGNLEARGGAQMRRRDPENSSGPERVNREVKNQSGLMFIIILLFFGRATNRPRDTATIKVSAAVRNVVVFRHFCLRLKLH